MEEGQQMSASTKEHRIFHLCAYYAGSVVYRDLFDALSEDRRVVRQAVVIASRVQRNGAYPESGSCAVDIHFSRCLNSMTRLSLRYKHYRMDRFLRTLIEQNPDLRASTLIHAHTLYTDGVLAQRISRQFGVPFVVTVRATDVNIFDRLYPHWKRRIFGVMDDARRVIFPAPALQEQFSNKYPFVAEKSLVVPNGIDEFWISNAKLSKKRGDHSCAKGIYVGHVNRNKNLAKAILAFFDVYSPAEARFSVIGGTYDDYVRVYGHLPSMIRDAVRFHGHMDDRELIRAHLEAATVLVMPSHMETFGLVYLEAISQCTPVVYSRRQGIDGLFEEGVVGCACRPGSRTSIADAIVRLRSAFPEGLDFRGTGRNPVVNFSWRNVSKVLLDQVYA